jgi:hypothetical protein
MLNTAPIVLNCFSRGGSNIFWNVFLSHPDVCSPILETLQIFGAGIRHATVPGYALALRTRQRRLFDQWNLAPRKPVSAAAARTIDRVLFERKMRTLADPELRFKDPETVYAPDEVERARLVLKNNNGLVFLAGTFRELYSDAAFFGLVRHPVAVYESHLRHRTPPARSVDAFADFYNRICGRMHEDSRILPRYRLFRFEDLVRDPVGSIRKIYSDALLDLGRVRAVRFKAKRHFAPDGSYGSRYAAGRHHWFPWADVPAFFEPEINALQASRLHERDRSALLRATERIRGLLGYDDAGG